MGWPLFCREPFRPGGEERFRPGREERFWPGGEERRAMPEMPRVE